MPELPDVEVYVERMNAMLGGHVLDVVELVVPFTLRSVEPPLATLHGRALRAVSRLGKRLVLEFDSGLFLVMHLMISGRLRWKPRDFAPPRKRTLAVLRFDHGALVLTEASSKKRASLHLVSGRGAVAEFDRGGLEPLTSSLRSFRERMRVENRTLKRALTDPRLISGIGNAYSDEILHAARLSPVQRTRSLNDEEFKRLWQATKSTLKHGLAVIRKEVGVGFPDKVTAFRPDMAVHGKYGQPCPACAGPVQRVRFASNEMNYCPTCQTSGKLLADRGLSRLLKGDWPKTLEELEEIKSTRSGSERGNKSAQSTTNG
jgi:formamidopyrimidine-DNA glycosylase